MKEEELINFGFTQIEVPVEESGDKTNYYFYNYVISDNITLVSSASDEVKDDKWIVRGDLGSNVAICDIADLYMLKFLFERWETYN